MGIHTKIGKEMDEDKQKSLSRPFALQIWSKTQNRTFYLRFSIENARDKLFDTIQKIKEKEEEKEKERKSKEELRANLDTLKAKFKKFGIKATQARSESEE